MAGDFRVQLEHGGSADARQPDDHIVRTAEQAMEAMARCTHLRSDEILYARVDGVVQKGRFLLMELEAVEPCLFLGLAPDSAARMALCLEAAVATALNRS
jgi:glutathione synthase/RimK-type ligase-like ATP-grasp enzyme